MPRTIPPGRGPGRSPLQTLATALAILAVAGATPRAPSALVRRPLPDPPRLVVVLVVDQLRHDLLLRYRDLYTGGLKRLVELGLLTAATHDHGVTETSPGHASLSTGTHPSRHGIVANQWWDASTEGWTYAVSDPTTTVVGHGLEGSSPRFLLRDGLADWLLASDSAARVLSISAKDRAAILLRGRGGGPVFWFEPLVGAFVSSTFYFDGALPAWVREFNAERVDDWRADSVWTSRVPDSLRYRTRPDTASFEGDRIHTALPHRFHEEGALGSLAGEGIEGGAGFFDWFATTPALDEAVLDLATAGILAEGLGLDQHVDMLAISLSQTDRVGHAYGPLSREQLDQLMRLDAALGDFLEFLDRQVPDGWMLGMSADHGVRNIPEYDPNPDGTTDPRLTPDDRIAMLRAIVEAVQNPDRSRPISPAIAAATAAMTSPFVARSWVLGRPVEPADSLGTFMNRSFFVGRPPRIEARFGIGVAFHEGVLDSVNPSGTTHGSPYTYDRTVPFLIWRPGATETLVFNDPSPQAVDFAPTLAALAGIPVPDDLDGRPVVVDTSEPDRLPDPTPLPHGSP